MRGKTVFGLSILLVAFFCGAVSERHNLFPFPQLFALKDRLSREQPVAESRYAFDDEGRLASDETKTAVACPKQTDRTAVLLVLGQSNAANHGGQRYRSEYGAHVVNFFEGRCFIAASPLLGSSDTSGEYWTQLGNMLVKSGKIDDVVIAPLAFSGSEVLRWARGNDLNGLLVETVNRLEQQPYRITDALWVQGEIDYVKGTSGDAYRQRVLSMIDTLREQKVEAPFYVSIASKCLEPSNGGFKTHVADNPIVRAQLELSASGNGIRRGVNTDELLAEVDRFDDCHMGGTGEQKVAQAWADLLLENR